MAPTGPKRLPSIRTTRAKEIGGDLGTVNKGVMVPKFEEAVFSLAKDEISKPIKTSYGYHVIQVTGINAGEAVHIGRSESRHHKHSPQPEEVRGLERVVAPRPK